MARRASWSTSSSRLAGRSGNMSPYRSMKASKSSWVCSPRASASSISFRPASMSLTRWRASGSGLDSASFIPRNWLSSTSRRSSSLSCSNVSRAAAERHE